MRRRTIIAAIALVAIATLALSVRLGTSHAGEPEPPLAESPQVAPAPGAVAPGRIVVRFKDGAPADAVRLQNASAGARELGSHPRSGLTELQLPSGADTEAVLAAYRRNPLVELAGYSYIARALEVPNDTNYSYQWDMHDTTGGMWAQSAWDVATSHGQGVVVAVIDTGVAYENFTGPGPINPSTVYAKAPDLATKTFVAPTDIANGDAHPNDDNGHGTHVTGTIAEDTNNNYGLAGVAYNATIMPIKVLQFDGTGADADLVEALYYAVDNGARVINMSLGFTGTGTPDGTGTPCTEIVGLNAALDYAYSHGVVIAAAAGNDSSNVVTCPAAYPTVIAVGATRFDGTRPSYSNTGSALDVAAPGGDPNVDQNNDGFSDGVVSETYCYDYFSLLLLQTYNNFCDIFMSGTSMATPHVAGLAALLLGEDPTLTPDQVRGYIESTARDRGAAGWDPAYGWGEIDANAAVLALKGLGGTPTATSTNTPVPTATDTPPAGTPTSTPTATNTSVPTATATAAPLPLLHIGNLDGSSSLRRTNWTARVTVYVHDASHALVSGATVTGTWSGGASGTAACTTGRKGRCSLTSPRASNSATSITFKVTDVSESGYGYDPSANHDPDGSSDGTVIVITQ
jgi:serine protease